MLTNPLVVSHPEAPVEPDASDAALVAQVRSGQVEAFAVLMRRYNRRVFRAARSVLTSDAAAEDAAQDAWLSGYEGVAQWDAERGSFGTWIASVAVNHALGQLRRTASLDRKHQASERHLAAVYTGSGEAPEAAALRTEARRFLELAVDTLPEPLRQVFMLRDVEELSGAEAAQILNVSELTVRVRLFRARRSLRDAIEERVSENLHELFAFDGQRCDRIVLWVIGRLVATAS